MKADVLTLSSENNNKHSNGVGDIDTIQFVWHTGEIIMQKMSFEINVIRNIIHGKKKCS